MALSKSLHKALFTEGHNVRESREKDHSLQTLKNDTHGLPLAPVRRKKIALLQPNLDNPFEPLASTDFERLKADIEENGVLVPLLINAAGKLLDGHNRLRACIDLGLEDVPTQTIERDLTKGQETALMLRLQLNRRNLTPAKMTETLAKLYPQVFETEGSGRKKRGTMTLLYVAKETGKSKETIKRAKETHKKAVKIAELSGRTEPSTADYKAATEQKNAKRRELAKPATKPSKATPVDLFADAVTAVRDAFRAKTLNKADTLFIESEADKLLQVLRRK